MKIFCAILLMFCATLIWSSEPTPFMAKLIKIYQKDFEKLNTPAKESDFIAQLPKFFQCKNMKIKQNWTFYAPKGESGTAPYFGGVIYHQTKGYHLISLRLNSPVIEITKLGNPKAFYFHSGIIYVVHLTNKNKPIISGLVVSDITGDYHGTDSQYSHWQN